jgi:protein-S-isoprenylcysteine O-methyltransferase Ste14
MSAKFILSVTVQTTVWLGIMALVLFLAAGNWRWPEGWAFMAIFGFGSVGFIAWLGPRDPALLQSRMDVSARPEQPWWDKLFLFVFIGFWFVWMAGMAVDSERWQLSHVPTWLEAVGGVLICSGFLATMRVFAVNSFAAPNIRVQENRGQHVIDTGPYAWVRHPMYASAVLYLFGLPLLFGSWWGFIGSAVFITGMALRSIGEENTLKRELPGYAEYMTRVRYRLVPGVF